MRKLRIKKKITPSTKALEPIFSEAKFPDKEEPAHNVSDKSVVKKKVSKPEHKPKNITVKVKKKVLPSLSISINKPVDKVSEPTEHLKETKSESKPTTITPLEQESLNKAWKALLAFIPEDQITLRQSLKSNLPEIISETEFKFMVSNKFQAENLQERMAMVLDFLQGRLENNALKMQVLVSDKVESNLVFTANDKFKLMVEKNPVLEELRKRLDLEVD